MFWQQQACAKKQQFSFTYDIGPVYLFIISYMIDWLFRHLARNCSMFGTILLISLLLMQSVTYSMHDCLILVDDFCIFVRLPQMPYFSRQVARTWLHNAGTYPVIFATSFGLVLVSYFGGRKVAFHPDIHFNRQDRTAGIETQHMEYHAAVFRNTSLSFKPMFSAATASM